MAERRSTSPRRGVPWWTPLLGLPVLAAAVAVGGVLGNRPGAGRHTPAAAHVMSTRHVLGMRKTIARHPTVRPKQMVGTRFRGRRARVLSVVGREIFWIRVGRSGRLLVHLQGPRAAQRIRPGARLTFTGVLARNPPGAAARWGLSIREGRADFLRQGMHLEAYRPRLRIACATECG